MQRSKALPMKPRNLPIYAIALVVILISTTAQAQPPGHKEFDKLKEDMRKKFDDGKANAHATFRQFKADSDSTFSKYLRESWEKVDLAKGFQPDNTKPPKPKGMPKSDTKPEDVKPNPIQVKESPDVKPTVPQVTDLTPPKTKPEDRVEDYVNTEIEYLGQHILLRYDKAFASLPLDRVDEASIGTFWEEAARSDYQTLQAVIVVQRNNMKFNDWGYYQLVRLAANKIYPDENRRKLLTWFLLCKAGFRAKVGFEGRQIHLLLPFANQVYGKSYYDLDGIKYYIIEAQKPGMRLSIHSKDYPGAENVMSLDIPYPMKISPVEGIRTLSFTALGRSHTIKVEYDQSVAKFFATYPWSQFDVYFNAEISEPTKPTLTTNLGPILDGHPNEEKVAIILAFVQKAFEYKTDGDQFGYEKPFFAEELFYYPYSDCEDRSVLFAQLVKEFTGLEVVGLHWPGHLATAVKFDTEVNGDFFKVGRDKYVVCDPTYINAPIGLTMPKFRGVQAEIIRLR